MKTKKFRIYLGFDSRERAAYDVARASILRRTSLPKRTQVFPIELENMQRLGLLTRPVERRDGKLWCPISLAPMATEFAISRFAVPFLAKDGWTLFADSDVLCLADIGELFALADDRYAVMVVKHHHAPVETIKMDGQIQTIYPRKNWSSVVLWNCSHPANQNLTLEALNTWPGRDLHAFKWLKDEEIGELPRRWNWLVGVTENAGDEPGGKLLHYTLGGPWFKDWKSAPLDEVWLAEAKEAGVRV